jgi:hypothetical protein
MNQKQKAKWERTSSKGMWHFVLLQGVLLWGASVIFVITALRISIGIFASVI